MLAKMGGRTAGIGVLGFIPKWRSERTTGDVKADEVPRYYSNLAVSNKTCVTLRLILCHLLETTRNQ